MGQINAAPPWIQRALLALEDEGGELFFGEPELEQLTVESAAEAAAEPAEEA